MDILSTLLRLQSRKIGVIIPDVVVSEKHSDTLEITEHPVETGRQFPITPISAPAKSSWRLALLVAARCWILPAADQYVLLGMSPRETYQKLLDLQAVGSRSMW
jgi:hypothetical protein